MHRQYRNKLWTGLSTWARVRPRSNDNGKRVWLMSVFHIRDFKLEPLTHSPNTEIKYVGAHLGSHTPLCLPVSSGPPADFRQMSVHDTPGDLRGSRLRRVKIPSSGSENLLFFSPQAFGNAKTAHNNNSSRFGKFIQVNYLESGIVRG